LRVTGSAKHRHSCAKNVSAIAFGVGRVNDLHPRAQPQASRRQTFNSDAIQRLYERADYPMQQRRIDAGIWVDAAAAIT
jgi:hypothetical protein